MTEHNINTPVIKSIMKTPNDGRWFHTYRQFLLARNSLVKHNDEAMSTKYVLKQCTEDVIGLIRKKSCVVDRVYL